jgi:hypothetical protein
MSNDLQIKIPAIKIPKRWFMYPIILIPFTVMLGIVYEMAKLLFFLLDIAIKKVSETFGTEASLFFLVWLMSSTTLISVLEYTKALDLGDENKEDVKCQDRENTSA